MNRRDFCKGLFGVAAIAAAPPLLAAQPGFWEKPRSLWLVRAGTQEQVKATYFHDGTVDKNGYAELCHLLRDVRAGQSTNMSIELLDILRGIQGWFELNGQRRPLIIQSGFRTLHTNKSTEGASKNSMHLYGRAADIRIPDVPVSYIEKLGLYLRGGGVGTYVGKGFVHVDDAGLRNWRR